jgi:hypothetical protein
MARNRMTWTSSSFGFAYAGGFLLTGPLPQRRFATVLVAIRVLQATPSHFAVSTRRWT